MVEDNTAAGPDIDFEAWRAAIRRDAVSNYHYCMGRAIAREGDRAAAIAQFRAAIAADADMVAAHAELAELLRAEGREEDARTAERAAGSVSPDWRAEALLRRGEELAATNHAEDALAAFAAAAATPSVRAAARAAIADIHFGRALHFEATGAPERAIPILRDLIREGYDGDNPALHHALSVRLLLDGDRNRAAVHARAAVDLTTPGGRADYALHAARLFSDLGWLDEARPLLDEVQGYDGDSAVHLFDLAQCLLAFDRIEDAVPRAVKAHRLAPADARSGYAVFLATLLRRRRRDEEALAVLHREALQEPGNPLIRNHLADAAVSAGHAALGLRLALPLIALAPGQPAALVTLGYALYATGHGGEAGRAFHRALVIESGHAMALAALALPFADAGRHDDAAALGREGLARAGNGVERTATLVPLLAALLDAGRREDAEAVLRRSLAAIPPQDRGLLWARARRCGRHAPVIAALLDAMLA